jgi:FAD/FMN-containing dehydrogenase
MTDPGATLLARVAGAVGPAQVRTDAGDLAPHLLDWRGRYRGAARALVLPGSTAEVAAVVSICRELRVPVVPQGGNTSLCGAATPSPDGGAIVLSLARMQRVRSCDVANAALTIESGAPLAAAQAAAEQQGMMFPLSLASEGSCTIGGVLSTNAGGTAVLRYGNARELVLGLEAVLPDGRLFEGLRSLRKDNTGYDLKQLFIGAEGTLGVITAAVLKLYPAPRSRATALAAVPDVDAAVRLLGMLRDALADRLVGFELMSAFSTALSRRHHPHLPDPLPGHPWYALVQADDAASDDAMPERVEAALGRAVEGGTVVDATVARSAAQSAALWALRENISEGQRREGPNIKHDISLPVSAIPRFLRDAEAALSRALPGLRFVVFGHLGDGNLHYNLSAPEGTAANAFMGNEDVANRIVYDLVAAAGGSISAEHGIGQLKRGELRRYKPVVEIELMARVKAAFDPEGIMNPGKVL